MFDTRQFLYMFSRSAQNPTNITCSYINVGKANELR